MCYNVAYLEQRAQKYMERYQHLLGPNAELPSPHRPPDVRYFASGFEFPLMPVVTHKGIFFFNWGLIPFWVKDLEQANKMRSRTLNAVGETVFEKPSFRDAVKTRRCLLGISGFYEWRDFNKVKYPYFIQVEGEELFSLGCIYDTWVDKATGEIFNTFSLITTAANPLMEQIHNSKKRMPLIISRKDEAKWIDPATPLDEVQSLIKPFPDKEMKYYTISREANNVRNNRNVPEILQPVEYPELDFPDAD